MPRQSETRDLYRDKDLAMYDQYLFKHRVEGNKPDSRTKLMA